MGVFIKDVTGNVVEVGTSYPLVSGSTYEAPIIVITSSGERIEIPLEEFSEVVIWFLGHWRGELPMEIVSVLKSILPILKVALIASD